MAEAKQTKPGNAGITKIGHTSGTQFGTNMNAQPKAQNTPTEVNLKG